MEILSTAVNQKIDTNIQKFICEACHYNTSKRVDYLKHTSTQKHKKAILATPPETLATKSITCPDKYECTNCRRKYSDRSGLWRHRKVCEKKHPKSCENVSMVVADTSVQLYEKSDTQDENEKLKHTTSMMLELIKQNQEFKNILIEQNNAMIELAKKPQISNSTIHHTTQNNQFNLSFFLNEQCKDAVNLIDFVNSIELQLNDLENTAKYGFVEGISRIFIDALAKLDVYKRPLHCTDLKRDVLYVKDQDKWEKEAENKPNIKKAVGQIVNKNLQQIEAWQEKNPEFAKANTKDNDDHIKILLSALGGSSPNEADKNTEKIVKNIAKEVVLVKGNTSSLLNQP